MKAQAATAIAVYHDTIRPTRQRRQQFVLRELAMCQWASACWPTALELLAFARVVHSQCDVNTIRPRLTELWKAKRVVKGPARKCRVSGKTSLTWELPAGNGRLF